MGKKDPRIDAYIAKSSKFAQPVMKYIRKVVHAGCPDVEETLKWNNPSFMFRGILCGMAAFNEHCVFGFWHRGMEKFIKDSGLSDGAMRQFGRVTSVSDLPKEELFKHFVQEAAKLNASGIKPPRIVKKKKPPAKVPADLAAALKKNKKAQATFKAFSPSNQREYIEWITEAKREETRAKRLATAIEWISEGKSRNWKYEKC